MFSGSMAILSRVPGTLTGGGGSPDEGGGAVVSGAGSAVACGAIGMNGGTCSRDWKMEEGGGPGASSGEGANIASSCSTSPSGLQCLLAVTVARGGVDAVTDGMAVCCGDWTWWARPTPGLQCCLSETVAGGKADGGVAIPARRDGDSVPPPRSQGWMLFSPRMASVSSTNWGGSTPSSWVRVVGSEADGGVAIPAVGLSCPSVPCQGLLLPPPGVPCGGL